MQLETLSRILAELKASGLLRVDRSRLFIPDPAEWMAVCH